MVFPLILPSLELVFYCNSLLFGDGNCCRMFPRLCGMWYFFGPWGTLIVRACIAMALGLWFLSILMAFFYFWSEVDPFNARRITGNLTHQPQEKAQCFSVLLSILVMFSFDQSHWGGDAHICSKHSTSWYCKSFDQFLRPWKGAVNVNWLRIERHTCNRFSKIYI